VIDAATGNRRAVEYRIATLDDEMSKLVNERHRTTLPARRHDIADEIEQKLDARLELSKSLLAAAA
jgi:hypothetical protein